MSGGLGGRADHALFAVLRSLADVVLVAAGTVRAERYGPSATPIAVVSRSLRLDWDARFFTAPVACPILVTVAQAPPDQLARAAEVADVVIAGDRDVDLATAPPSNGQLARAGLLDELCLTLSPALRRRRPATLLGPRAGRVPGSPLSPATRRAAGLTCARVV